MVNALRVKSSKDEKVGLINCSYVAIEHLIKQPKKKHLSQTYLFRAIETTNTHHYLSKPSFTLVFFYRSISVRKRFDAS